MGYFASEIPEMNPESNWRLTFLVLLWDGSRWSDCSVSQYNTYMCTLIQLFWRPSVNWVKKHQHSKSLFEKVKGWQLFKFWLIPELDMWHCRNSTDVSCSDCQCCAEEHLWKHCLSQWGCLVKVLNSWKCSLKLSSIESMWKNGVFDCTSAGNMQRKIFWQPKCHTPSFT